MAKTEENTVTRTFDFTAEELVSCEKVKAKLMAFIQSDDFLFAELEDLINQLPYTANQAIQRFKLDKDKELQYEIQRRLTEVRNAARMASLKSGKNFDIGYKVISKEDERERLSATYKPTKKKETPDTIVIQHV